MRLPCAQSSGSVEGGVEVILRGRADESNLERVATLPRHSVISILSDTTASGDP